MYINVQVQLITVHVTKNFNDDLNPVIQINYNFKSVIKKDNIYFNRITDMSINTKKQYPFFKEIINIDIDCYINDGIIYIKIENIMRNTSTFN